MDIRDPVASALRRESFDLLGDSSPHSRAGLQQSLDDTHDRGQALRGSDVDDAMEMDRMNGTIKATPRSAGLDDEDDDLEAIGEEDILLAPSTGSSGKAERIGSPIAKARERGSTSANERAAEMVAKVVPATDDPTLTTLTARVMVIGTLLGAAGSAISQIAYFKSNGFGLSTFFVILISYPMGHGLAKWLPARQVSILGRWSFNLNPGRFSVKEHLLIGVISGCASSAAYAGDIVTVQQLYYHQDMGHFGGLLLLLSTQMLGFGLAGLTYSILIRPTAMLWPSSLVVISLYNTLHSHGTGIEDLLTRKRLRFFSIAFVLIYTYQFIPAVIAPAVTSIAVLCLINNRSVAMRVLGSAYTGAGMFTFSLDWSVIGSAASLYTPFFASFNFFAGLAWSMWVLVPILWFANFWDTQSFGYYTVAAILYDKDYNKYNVSAVVRPDFTLDEEKYAELGPIKLTPFFAISYGISFAVLTSAVVTVLLFHFDDIKSALADRGQRSSDVHVELVERNYENVPGRWYAILGGSMVLASIYVVLFYPLQLPVWGLALALTMSVFFIVPLGIIKATTNTGIGLNVITEFVAGFLLPGRPLANICFKVYGYMTMSQCLDLASDLKLGIYAKIPPKDMFVCQCWGTGMGSIINYVFIRSVISAKRSLLDGTELDPTGQWTGRKPQIFFSASVIWGLIGPARFFSGQYRVLYWGFPIGVVLPFIPWYLSKRYPGRIPWHKISFVQKWCSGLKLVWFFPVDYLPFELVVFLHGAIVPPQLPTNMIFSGFMAAFLSQFWALRYHSKWFEKYNYTLSAALDAGTSINALTVYMVGLHGWESWWNSKVDSEHCTPGS